jgi:hypothetical protein
MRDARPRPREEAWIKTLILLLALAASPERYCLDNVTPAGLAQDRASNPRLVSVAASGFAMVNWALELPRVEAITAVHRCLDATLAKNPARNRGWLAHFSDPDGTPRPDAEVSTGDSAIFYAGARKAARLLDAPGLRDRVEAAIAAVDVKWMQRGCYISHGVRWLAAHEPEFLPSVWDDLNEGVIVYRTFGIEWKPRRVTYDLPLFVYYYPLAFFDDPEMVTHLRAAVEYQKRTRGCWGFTACDGPEGYRANDPQLISPLAILTLAPFIPDAREYLARLGVPPDTPSLHRGTGWVATDRIGIDDMCYVAIVRQYENTRRLGDPPARSGSPGH